VGHRADRADDGRSQLLVDTDLGTVRGQRVGANLEFLGIPFAAPPVGERRWKSPAPASRWSGVRDATRPQRQCSAVAGGDGLEVVNEDCLYLNVYRPEARERKLPVVVFIHGGGYTQGSPNIYDGRRMAARGDAVVVLPAYRLGVFSGLALPSLTAESADGSSGNYGLLDQQAALRWVQRNIREFGGDPGRVSIVGQSAGAGAVCHNLVSPTAGGLFERAVIMAGGCSGRLLESAYAGGGRVAGQLGCTDAAKAAACLRALPADQVFRTAQSVPGGNAGSPTISGRALPLDPWQAIASGRFNKAEVMIGANLNDARAFALGLYPLSQDGFRQTVSGDVGAANVDRVLTAYPPSEYDNKLEYVVGAIRNDRSDCRSLRLAGSLDRSTSVYFYEFADRDAPGFLSLGLPFPTPPGYRRDAAHTDELQYLFNYQAVAGPLNAAQERLSEQMVEYWTSFADRGTPKASDGPKWPSWDSARERVMYLNTKTAADRTGSHVITDYRESHKCWLWDSIG
jgi:para-nitrobenzyl esterase